jgi:glucosamine-6-phosphate deaminase
MEVVIAKSYEDLSRGAAEVVAEVVNTKPNAVLGLATGSSPLGLYKELIRMHENEGLDFSRVTTFNLDEYVGLKPDHDQSYHYFMTENLFKHINVSPSRIHVPSGTTSNYQGFCSWYEQRIVECGGIDVQVLGIGSDGHIAFNEPTSSLASRTRLKTLTAQTIEDNARFFEKIEDVPIYSITMGVGTILEARKLVLVANGDNKADAVVGMIEGPVSSMITASALQLHSDSHVFIDEAASAKLEMLDYYNWIQEKKPGAPQS